jgi:hypothetical protein
MYLTRFRRFGRARFHPVPLSLQVVLISIFAWCGGKDEVSLPKSGGSRDEYRRFSVSLEFREVRSLTAAINYVIDLQRDCDTLP